MGRRNRPEDMERVSATALVRAYRKGTITLDELRDEFGRREWNEYSWAEERASLTDAERWIMAEDMAWDYSEAGTWGEVTSLYNGGELTDEEFGVLWDAVFGTDPDEW